MASRPGPLRDLPLERFIDVPFTPVPTTPQRTHKRPLSPGTPNLFSPTKRRILAQEGVFSPEKTVKSSITASDRALVIHDVLRQSPAFKLDFGRLPQTDGKVASTSRLFEDYFVDPTPEHSRSPRRHDHDHSSLPILNASPSQLLSIPPPSLNPQTNIHYPGFDVWVNRDLGPTSASSRSCLGDSQASDEDKENSHDDKENVHPKTKWRTGLSKRLKRVSLVSPKELRRPNTPKIPFTPLNAGSSLKARLPRELTLGKAPKVDGDEMKRRRELLAMELDGDDDSDDDL
ncbi:hypothetical protein BDM02DRAFT_1910557 [Thelephora ganbajun]|uniref:Uncharacterized protein n=1 Tax=Thelephora ganbajun TaxID=370292 RepID=A0ACB6ZUC0_THEGA|nr:hypothetical protein BDM02DRAFT_1910557 [Thelephora ganbajun]